LIITKFATRCQR